MSGTAHLDTPAGGSGARGDGVGGASSPPPWASDRGLWALVAVGAILALGLLVVVADRRPDLVTLGVLAVAAICITGIVCEVVAGRYFSLPLAVYVSVFLVFAVRPWFLLANLPLLGSYQPPRGTGDMLASLQSQEVALFITTRFPGDPRDFVGGGVAIGLVFIAAFACGHAVSMLWRGRQPGFPIVARTPAPEALAAVLSLLILLSLAGQGLIINGAGGIGAATAQLQNQGTLQQSFAWFVLANCGIAAAFLWAAFGPLRSWALAGFLLLLAEISLFGVLVGSRSRIIVPLVGVAIVIHLARRRFRLRELVAAFALAVVLATGFFATRVTSATRPFDEAVVAGARNSLNLGIVANDNSTFDAVAMMAAMVPEPVGRQDGRRLLSGLSAVVPSGLGPLKSESNDVWLRKQLWGDSRRAGRPYTFAGELWLDFGWAGSVLGGLGFGLLCGLFRGDRRTRLARGVAVVVAVSVTVAWGLMQGVYQTPVNQVLSFALSLGFGVLCLALLDGLGRDEETRRAAR